MNRIELILDNSIFEISQFNKAQIDALNEMTNSDITDEQVCIIAHPSVNELTYSVLYDYLSKGNSITSIEYQKYLSIDVDRINDIIVNVYLGKLHGLSDEQILLYAQKSVFNIKIARLLVEKSKDASSEQLSQLVSGKFGTKSIVGKQAIQDYINDTLSLEQLLSLTECLELTQDNYEYIKKADSRVLSIIKDFYKKYKDDTLSKNNLIKQSINIDNNNMCVDLWFSDEHNITHFDSLETYNKFLNIRKTIISDHSSKWDDHYLKVVNYYKNNFTNNNFIKLNEYKQYNTYYFDINSNAIGNGRFSDIINYYYNSRCVIVYDSINSSNNIKYSEEFSTFDEYLTVFMNTNGFKDYIQAKWINKLSDEAINMIKQGKTALDYLYSLYKGKDKETEIPYLKENLKEAETKQIDEVILMKEIKCSNDDIHLYIEKYLKSEKCIPSMYFNEDNDYNKYWSIYEFLKLNDLEFEFKNLYKLKQAECTDEDIQFIIDNNLKMDSDPIQKSLIDIYKEYGASNLEYCSNTYITYKVNETDTIINNYTYAKSTFKDKIKCIGYYINRDTRYRILDHLVKYIDNFDDDTFLKLIKSDYADHINFCLKMSNITTDLKILDDMWSKIDSEKISKFNQKDEKVTKDVVVKFCKDAKVEVPKELFEDQVDVAIERSVDYFGSSKNFKPIKYDEETIYVDIIGNKNLKGSHILTFNKEDDGYEYIFEIAHENDTLNYTSKITTKKDVIDSINKSISLIENVDEYKEYVEELQEMLKTI